MDALQTSSSGSWLVASTSLLAFFAAFAAYTTTLSRESPQTLYSLSPGLLATYDGRRLQSGGPRALIRHVVFAPDVREIVAGAFRGCGGLLSVRIPEGVTDVGFSRP